MKKNMLLVPAGLLLLAATACSAGSNDESAPAGDPIPRGQSAVPVTAAASNGEETAMNDPELETRAVAALAAKLSVPANTISLVSLNAKNWPDSSLGCPKPGVDYLQVITPGYLAVLRHDQRSYNVHMTDKQAFVCEKLTASQLRPSKPDPKIQQRMQEAIARQDLADRIQVPVADITVIESLSVSWNDTSLGCPIQGETYAQVVSAGYYFAFDYKGRRYVYHAGQDRVLPCPPIESE